MKQVEGWYSHRVQRDVRLVRWGHWGTPVLLFPTAGGDAEEVERFGLIGAIWHLIEAGRIKVYSTDSVAGQTWIDRGASPVHRAWIQNQYDQFVYHEVLPAIRADCRSDRVEVVTAGASLGAFNAVASVCRHPDAFRLAIAMSGTYDLAPWMHGCFTQDLYYATPLYFLPQLHGRQLDDLRRRMILIVVGEGPWDDVGESWRLADVLGGKGIPNRLDNWGPAYDHDWPAWRQQLPHYLDRYA